MTQSPPKAPISSRPPAAATGGGGGGRLTTALAAGGSVLVLSTIAVVLWPRTYGTEATFAVDGTPTVASPLVLAGHIEAALLERQELAGAAMELPPELRSPDPIGRLRAGIRVQSRGGSSYGVEFHGSDQQSVQRIANRLAERAVELLPQLASPEDKGAAQALATRTRAVTEFLTAHPEMTLEASGAKVADGVDSGLEALRTEKRQIELRLATGATDNPYSEPGQSPDILNRRLTEIKTTIARREKALKEPHPAAAPAVAPELVTQWRSLLGELATAQAAASSPSKPPVTGHITARAPLPSSPLTPNRLVLSVVALLLSAAAAMAAYALPRFSDPPKRKDRRPQPAQGRSDPPPTQRLGTGSDLPAQGGGTQPLLQPVSEPPAAPPAGTAGNAGSEPPAPPRPDSEPPARGSAPPQKRSDPPAGPIAIQRTVVLSGPQRPNDPPPKQRERSKTTPGGLGLEAPAAENEAARSTSPPAEPPAAATTAAPPTTGAHAPPAAPLFSRPPPGAGSYSVSSSHPPAMESRTGARTSVERLSPLQSANPPISQGAPATRRGASPIPQAAPVPQIVSLPPALDPQAETWATRFETPPPPPPDPEPAPQPAAPAESPKRSGGRWKTQVMGSMVPLEVMEARERSVPSVPPESLPTQAIEPVKRHAPAPSASTTVQHDLPFGWEPKLPAPTPEVLALRDALQNEASTRRLTVTVTGSASSARAQLASSLAMALAANGGRVLIVEADFDSPSLHQVLAFSAPPGAGFSQQLMARRHAKHPEPWVVMRCSANLQAMAEGRFRSPGLLTSREFEQAITELRDQYQIVLIVAPALTKVDDLRSLSPLASAVVVAAQPGQLPRLQVGNDALRSLLV